MMVLPQVREIKQFCFHAWPDHGAPESTKDLLDFYWLAKASIEYTSHHNVIHTSQSDILQSPLQGPPVVHCSAGVGRSGTFIALDWYQSQFTPRHVMCVGLWSRRRRARAALTSPRSC